LCTYFFVLMFSGFERQKDTLAGGLIHPSIAIIVQERVRCQATLLPPTATKQQQQAKIDILEIPLFIIHGWYGLDDRPSQAVRNNGSVAKVGRYV